MIGTETVPFALTGLTFFRFDTFALIGDVEFTMNAPPPDSADIPLSAWLPLLLGCLGLVAALRQFRTA